MVEIDTLVRDAQAGDKNAANTLALRYKGHVYSYALGWLKDPAEAELLTQDVLAHAFFKLKQLQYPKAYLSWLRRTTYRMAISRITSRRITSELTDHPGDFKTPEDHCIAREEVESLRAAVDRLRPDDRRTITDFYLNQKSIKELAEAHAAPVGTIKRRLHVARHRLREEMELATR